MLKVVFCSVVTNAIPECRGTPLLKEEISHRICANPTSRLWDVWGRGVEPSNSPPPPWLRACSLPFCCQYQCNWLPGKIHNDLLCVEWDVKLH